MQCIEIQITIHRTRWQKAEPRIRARAKSFQLLRYRGRRIDTVPRLFFRFWARQKKFLLRFFFLWSIRLVRGALQSYKKIWWSAPDGTSFEAFLNYRLFFELPVWSETGRVKIFKNATDNWRFLPHVDKNSLTRDILIDFDNFSPSSSGIFEFVNFRAAIFSVKTYSVFKAESRNFNTDPYCTLLRLSIFFENHSHYFGL